MEKTMTKKKNNRILSDDDASGFMLPELDLLRLQKLRAEATSAKLMVSVLEERLSRARTELKRLADDLADMGRKVRRSHGLADNHDIILTSGDDAGRIRVRETE